MSKTKPKQPKLSDEEMSAILTNSLNNLKKTNRSIYWHIKEQDSVLYQRIRKEGFTIKQLAIELVEQKFPATKSTLRATISKVLNEYEVEKNISKPLKKKPVKKETVKNKTLEQDRIEDFDVEQDIKIAIDKEKDEFVKQDVE